MGNKSKTTKDGKTLAFSVSIHDCEVQTFRGSGAGGQHRNKTDSAVRIIHHPSGARAECQEQRSQLQNKKVAFRRLTETHEFKMYINRRLAQGPSPEERVEKDMQPKNLLVEGRETGTWAPIPVDK